MDVSRLTTARQLLCAPFQCGLVVDFLRRRRWLSTKQVTQEADHFGFQFGFLHNGAWATAAA